MLLKTYLSRPNVTLATFAKKAGVSRAVVYLWLNGDRQPSLTNIIAIEAATDGKVTRRDLRPDWFPAKKRAAA